MKEFILDPSNHKMKDNPKGYETEKRSKNEYIPDLTDDQLRKLSREKLSEALQAVSPSNQPELTRKLCAELMDRLDGKPAQTQAIDIRSKSEVVSISLTDQEILKYYLEGKSNAP